MTIVVSFCGLCVLLVAGQLARAKIKLFQNLFLPSSVIAGLLGLIILQVGQTHIPAIWTAGWGKLPGFLINIVFAALFLGVKIPNMSNIWKKSAPQLAYGQIVAWGQYVVGLGLVLFFLSPVFKISHLFGVIIPVGFEGGHGTAGGLKDTFIDLSWPQGSDIALASATCGILSAIFLGVFLINWAIRKGYVKHISAKDIHSLANNGLYPADKMPPAGQQTTRSDSIDSLAFHIAMLGTAMLFGYLIKIFLVFIEAHIDFLGHLDIFRRFPLFPLCMIGGLLLQMILSRFSSRTIIDHSLMQRIGGSALDFLVVAAISTIRIESLISDFLPFLILIMGGIIWNLFCVMYLGRRMLPEDSWFERAIAEMGQSMGVTATGLLLLRVVDPDQKTDATSAFGYKQLLHEPFMGGGLWTSVAVLLVARQGAILPFCISIAAIIIWVIVWKKVIRKMPGLNFH